MTEYRFPIKTGDRVAIAPHLDLWMRGVRYGNVVATRRTRGEWVIDVLCDDGKRRDFGEKSGSLLGAVK